MTEAEAITRLQQLLDVPGCYRDEIEITLRVSQTRRVYTVVDPVDSFPYLHDITDLVQTLNENIHGKPLPNPRSSMGEAEEAGIDALELAGYTRVECYEIQ